MPELPDVEGFRRLLDRNARQARIADVEVADGGVLHNVSPNKLKDAAVGARFGRPSRHGKWLLAPFTGRGTTLMLHFGMTGSLQWSRPPREHHPHDRVTFAIDGGELAYRDQRKLRGLWLASGDDEVRRVMGKQGPDALGITGRELDDRLRGRKKGLKAALMDQSVIAGVGNLTADEVLWRARLHPNRHFDALDRAEQKRLEDALRQVLRAGIRQGQLPSGRGWLTGVRDEPDAVCPRCGTHLETGRTGGRSTYWCPSCQPATPSR